MIKDISPSDPIAYLADNPDLFRVRDVASELGMTRAGVLAAIHRGELNAVRIPIPFTTRPLFFVRQKDVDAFLATPRNTGGRPRKKTS